MQRFTASSCGNQENCNLSQQQSFQNTSTGLSFQLPQQLVQFGMLVLPLLPTTFEFSISVNKPQTSPIQTNTSSEQPIPEIQKSLQPVPPVTEVNVNQQSWSPNDSLLQPYVAAPQRSVDQSSNQDNSDDRKFDGESVCDRPDGFLTEPLVTSGFAKEYLQICKEIPFEAPKFSRDLQAVRKLIDVLFLGTETDVHEFWFNQEHLQPVLMLVNARRCKQTELR